MDNKSEEELSSSDECFDKNLINVAFLLEQVMKIHLISRKILHLLDFETLLSMSLVSKSWNSVARRFVRENRICLGVIGGGVPCQSVVDFNQLLATSFNPPFNGASIYTEPVSHPFRHVCIPVNGLDINRDMRICEETGTLRKHKDSLDASDLFSEILTKIDFKHLEIKCENVTSNYCTAFQLIHKILLNFHSSLQYLNIRSLPAAAKDGLKTSIFGDAAIPAQWLPSLKTFVPPGEDDYDEMYDSVRILKQIFVAAPNLGEVVGEVSDWELEPFFEEKICTIRTSRVELSTEMPLLVHKLLKVEHSLHIRKLVLVFSYPVPMNGDTEGIYETLKLVQEKLSKTLEEMEIEQVALIMLSSKRHFRFKQLRNLIIQCTPYVDRAEGFFTLGCVDFTWLFPYLIMVEIKWGSPAHELRLITDEFLNVVEHQSVSVTKFCISSYFSESIDWIPWFDNMARLFPNVKDLFLNEWRGSSFHKCFQSLWGAWTGVETITLRFCSLENMCKNYDSCVLGVLEEEVEEMFWRVAESEFDELNLVPIRPCMFTCENLKKIMFIMPPQPFPKASVTGNKCLLSELSHRLGFKRSPHLTFEVIVELWNERDRREYNFNIDNIQSSRIHEIVKRNWTPTPPVFLSHDSTALGLFLASRVAEEGEN